MPSQAAPDFDISSVDVEGFLRELKALREQVDASLGEADAAHLRKIERWGRTATLLGAATCWIAPNPFSAAALSVGRSTRWLLMHHVGHRGYDRVPGLPASRTGKGFAKGRRRYLDWLDWMLPEAWVFEHNVLHHSHTGEDADPDLLERNAGARCATRSGPWRFGTPSSRSSRSRGGPATTRRRRSVRCVARAGARVGR